MTQKTRSHSRALWSAATVLLAGVTLFVFTLILSPATADSSGVLLLVAAVAFTTVGALILARSDGNRIGWVVSAIGLTILASGVVGFQAENRGSVVAGAVGGALWLSWFVLVGLLVLWFPTGAPLSPRWRWVGWIGFLAQLISLTYIVSEELCVEGGDVCRVWVDNPIGITGVPNPEFGPFSGVNFGLLAIFVLLSTVSLIVRSVRAKGVERIQIKWFLFAVVFAIAVIVLQEALVDRMSIPEWIGEVLFGVTVLMIPATIAIAVLRYRLYEIDRIVARTVSYTMVVGLLGLVFFGVVTLVTSLLPAQNDLAVAGSTLAVAALFNPVRRRVQGWVDRRFNRSRYDAQMVMDAFSGSLRNLVDPDGVVEGWVGAVSETMQPSSVGVWVREAK